VVTKKWNAHKEGELDIKGVRMKPREIIATWEHKSVWDNLIAVMNKRRHYLR